MCGGSALPSLADLEARSASPSFRRLSGERLEVPLDGSGFDVRARLAALLQRAPERLDLLRGQRRLTFGDLSGPAHDLGSDITVIVLSKAAAPVSPEELKRREELGWQRRALLQRAKATDQAMEPIHPLHWCFLGGMPLMLASWGSCRCRHWSCVVIALGYALWFLSFALRVLNALLVRHLGSEAKYTESSELRIKDVSCLALVLGIVAGLSRLTGHQPGAREVLLSVGYMLPASTFLLWRCPLRRCRGNSWLSSFRDRWLMRC